MAKIDAIEIPKLLFDEGAAPSTPAATNVVVYAKSDGLMYSKDDAGVETVMSGSAAAVAAGASVTHSSNQALSASTFAALNFNTEVFDTNAYHDTVTNNTRLTVPSGKAGYYVITGRVSFAPSTSADRILGIRKNGTGTTGPDLSYVRLPLAQHATNPTRVETSCIAYLAVGDWIELIAYSGGALDSQTSGPLPGLSMVLLGT